MLRAVVRLLVAAVVVAASLSTNAPSASAAVTALDDTRSPFWLVTDWGDVWNFGSAPNYGDLKGGPPLNRQIVGITPTTDSGGYWLVGSDGGVFSFGNASFFGSTGHLRLNQPIVGITPTPTGNGYWLVATDGGIFAFGDARFFGSTGSIALNKPIVGMASTPSGNGYWLVASDGGIFAYGDAAFYGSTGSLRLQQPITAMTSAPSGNGYYLVAADGGIFAFGNAPFHGSAGGSQDDSYQKLIATQDGLGYWLVRNGGDVVGFGNLSSNTRRPAIAMPFKITGPGDAAAAYAMDQLGDRYLWGGNGPDAFDCSGLTSQAWRRGGAVIPRVANDQSAFGPKVGLDQLRTGDLLYWGPDRSNTRSIDHVGMYIGGGWAVNAGGTGTGVNIRSVPRTQGWMFGFGTRPRS